MVLTCQGCVVRIELVRSEEYFVPFPQARVDIHPPLRPGREVPTPPGTSVGLEAKSLKKWDDPPLVFPGPAQTNKQTNKK